MYYSIIVLSLYKQFKTNTMCTITTQQEPILTDVDIECYKMVQDNTSPSGKFKKFIGRFIYYAYKLNEVDTADFTFENLPETMFNVFDVNEEEIFYDCEKQNKFNRIYGQWEKVVFPEFVGKLKSVKCGFHSTLTKERLKPFGNLVMVKCVIPKGSLVYYGVTDLIVSNQIIVTDLIVSKQIIKRL